MALNKQEFQTKLKEAAGKMKAAGRSNEEIQSFINKKKDEYRAKYGEGKTEDAQIADAPVASENTELSSENGSSESQKEEVNLQAQAIALQNSIPGMHPGAVDKVAALTSGVLEMFSNITKVPRQATYGILSSAYELFNPEAVDTPEEKQALMNAIETVSRTSVAGGIAPGSLEAIGDKAKEVADDFSKATTKHDKTIGEQALSGDILGAVDQTVQQIAFTAPSVAAAFAGPGGIGLLGASAFGGKFEEEYEKDPAQAGSKLFLVSTAAAGIEIVSESVTAGIAGRAKALLSGKGKAAAQQYLAGIFQSVAAQANVEGWSEVAATVGNKYLDSIAYGREINLGELIKESLDSYIIGAAIGGGIAKVGQAGAPGSVERELVDAKAAPESVKESNNQDAEKENILESQRKDVPAEGQQVLDDAKAKLRDSIEDRVNDVSDVHDTLQNDEDASAWEHYIDNQLTIDNNAKLLDNPTIPDQTKEIIQEEVDRARQENQETYANAKAKTTNTSEAINSLNYWTQTDTTGFTEEQQLDRAKEVVKTEKKLEDKLAKESQDDAHVSKSTKKELERGNVQVEVDGKKRKYVRTPKVVKPKSQDQLIDDLDAIQESGVVENPTIENGQIVGTDTKSGARVVARPRDYGTIFTNWAAAISRTSGYSITPEAVAAVQTAEQSVEPAKAYIEEAAAPGVTEAIDKYNQVQKIVKSLGALRNKQGEVTGELPAISDQHRAISSLIAPLRNVAKANEKLNQLDRKIAAEKAARPTVTADGVQTGGADPAKIADLEAQRDLAVLDIQDAIANIPDDVEIPDFPFSPESRLKEEREAIEADKLKKLQDKLAGLKVNKKNSKEISNLKRRIRALREQSAPDIMGKYIADLRRGGKVTKDISDKDIAKFTRGKRTDKKVKDMAEKIARFIQSRSKIANFGVQTVDAIQEANIAAIEALKKTNAKTSSELFSDVANAVKTRLAAYRRQSKFMPLPVTVQTNANKIRKVEEQLITKLERYPTIQEISDATGIEVDKVKEIKTAVFENTALAQPETTVAEDGEQVSILELIQDVSRESNRNKSLSGTLLTQKEINDIDNAIKLGFSARDVINQAFKGRNLSEFADKFDAIVKNPEKAEFIVDAVEAPSASPAYKKVKGKVLDILSVEAQERAYSGWKDRGFRPDAQFDPFRSGVVPARYFPKPIKEGGKGILGGQTAEGDVDARTIPSFQIQEGGTTRDSDLGYPAITEVNTHGEFDQQTLLDDIDHILDNYSKQLLNGQWVAWTPGKQGKDHIKSLKMQQKADLVKEYVEDNGFAFVKDNTNPGLYRIEAPVSFNGVEQPLKFKQHNDLDKVEGTLVQLNVGLENNPMSYEDLEKLVNNIDGLTAGTTEQHLGEYEGNPERTIVIEAKYRKSPEEFKKMVKRFSDLMTQEAIAVTYDGKGELIWGSNQEAKYSFDPEYFVLPSSPNLSVSDGNREYGARAGSNNPYIQNIAKFLQKNWPNIEIIATPQEYSIATAALGVKTMPKHLKGWQHGNKIGLNPDQVGLDTPIHEFAHIWLRGLQRQNPKLWLRGQQLLKGSPYMNVVFNNPTYRQYLKDGDKARFWEEVMANAIGKRGAEIFTGEKASKWDQFVKDFGSWVKKTLGIKSDNDYADLTLEEWLDIAVHGTVTNTNNIVQQVQLPSQQPSYGLAEIATYALAAPVFAIGSAYLLAHSGQFFDDIIDIVTYPFKSIGGKKRKRNEALKELDSKINEVKYNLDSSVPNYKEKFDVWEAKTKLAFWNNVASQELSSTFAGLQTKGQDQVKSWEHELSRREKSLRELEGDIGPSFNISEFNENNDAISNIESLLNDPYTYKTSSPYKHSKIDQATREFLRDQKIKFSQKAHTYTPDQLGQIEQNIKDVIEAGRQASIDRKADIKEAREDIGADAANIIETVAGIDPDKLNTNDIDVLAKENTRFFHRLKTRGVGGVIADALSPSSNDDFHGLLNRLLIGKKGDARTKAENIIGETLLQPLKQANHNYIKDKQGMLANYITAVENLANAKGEKVSKTRKFLGKPSGIKVGRSTLTNNQIAMVYNYIKDPRLHPQLTKGGVNIDKMTEILDYVDNNTEFKSFINSIPNIFSNFKGKLNAKLDKHGYRTVADPIIGSDIDADTKGILNRIYDGQIPAEAPYTPFFGEGAETLDITSEMFEGGDKGNFYSVMTGRLKQRTYGGNVDFKGKDLESMIHSYVNGPVRTAAFLDFSKNASAFFNSKNLKAARASLGDSWGKSMEDSLRRIVTGSNNRSSNPESITLLDKWLNRSIANIMFFNPRSALLQQVSILNFAINDPVTYIKSAGNVSDNQKALSLIWNSDFIKDRAEGKTDVVVGELFKQKGTSGIGKAIDRLGETGYFLTKKSDAFAIAIGGAPYLAAKIKEYGGFDNAQAVDRAMADFIQVANEAQQSTSPERLGRDQTHPVGRYLLAFTNATQQFNRIMSKSAREIAAGKNVAGNTAKISYIMGTQIAGFAFLQKAMTTAFDFEDEDDKKKWGDYFTAIFDTLASSAGILGSVFATTAQAVKHLARGAEEGGFKKGTDMKVINEFINISPAVATKVRNIRNALNEPYRQSEGFVDVDAKVARVASAIQLSGLPTERVLRIFEQFNDIGANDLYVLEKAFRVLGWSRYDLGQQLGKEKKGRRGRTLQTRKREERAKARQTR